jgi:hypothetical protein
MKCVLGRLLVQASHEFEAITGIPFIELQETKEMIESATDEVLKFLIEAFLGMWSGSLADVVWESVEAIDEPFAIATDLLLQFLRGIALPQDLYLKSTEFLVDLLLPIIEELSGGVDRLSIAINSFEFHWRYFVGMTGALLAPASKKKLADRIGALAKKVFTDAGCDPAERMKPKIMDSAVEKAVAVVAARGNASPH